MSGLELLEKYPEAAVVIREFYTKELVNSLKDGNYPDEFKEFALAQPLDNQYISEFINTAPRGLFDVFDANEVYIEIVVSPDKKFTWVISNLGTTTFFDTRKEAEAEAVEAAFQILNEKLCQTAS